MRIAINALALKSAGNIAYFSNILPEIDKQDRKNDYFVFLPEDYGNKLELNLGRVKIVEVKLFNKSLILREFYEQFILPSELKSRNIDLLYCPSDIIPLFAPCKVVLAIRNPNPYFSFGNKSLVLKIKFKIQKFITRLSALKAKKVVFVSEFSKKEIARQLGIKEEKNIVIHHGINQNFLKTSEKKIDEKWQKRIDNLFPYILSVSNLYPHKNFEILLKAYARIDEDIKNRYKLVITGEFTFPDYYSKLKKLARECAIDNQVIFLEWIPYQMIPYLYKRSILFVLPSFLETFGHPLLETMASGTPLIAANSTAIPEIVGEAGLLFDPANYQELAEKMTFCLKNDKIRKDLVEKGYQRIKDFSWEKSVERLLEIFKNETGNPEL